MQFGKSIIGAIIGAAVGVGLLVAIYALFGLDKTWLSILAAVAVGLGVRTLVSTHGHASYLRGALTAIVAIATFAGGQSVIAKLAEQGAFAHKNKVERIAQPDKESAEGATDENAAPVEPVAMPQQDDQPRPVIAPVSQPRLKQAFSTWDYIWLCVAGLVAYELGRGTGTAPTNPENAPKLPE